MIQSSKFDFRVVYEDCDYGQLGIFVEHRKIGNINYRFLHQTPTLLYITLIIRDKEYIHQSLGYLLLDALIKHILQTQPIISKLVLNSGFYKEHWLEYGFIEEINLIESSLLFDPSKMKIHFAYKIR